VGGDARAASDVLRVRLVSLEAPSAHDLSSAFDLAVRQRVDAILMFDCSSLHPSAARITELAMKNRLPALYPFSYYPEAGGLMSYGPSVKDAARRAAGYVDKIVKGAKPAALPVQQPTTFELVINLKTAKALKLKVPQSLLVRADQVIEGPRPRCYDEAHGRIAQLEERGPYKAEVPGSIPGPPTRKINRANSLAIFVSESLPNFIGAVRGWK
jgi:ABC transporter substrate binding protein